VGWASLFILFGLAIEYIWYTNGTAIHRSGLFGQKPATRQKPKQTNKQTNKQKATEAAAEAKAQTKRKLQKHNKVQNFFFRCFVLLMENANNSKLAGGGRKLGGGG